MALPLILGSALSLVDKLFPNPKDAADAKLKVLELQSSGELAALNAELQLAVGQMEINKAEAYQQDVFRGGWRPFIGWTCGSAFAFNFVVLPLLITISALMGNPIVVAPLDMSEMLPVLLGMLGLGGFRTYEKLHTKKH